MNDKVEHVKCRCGGEAIVDRNGPNWTVIHCEKCGIHLNNFNTEAEAITAWNRVMGERIAKVEKVEKPNVFKCGECGQYFHQTAWGSPVEYCLRCGCRLEWDEDTPMEYFESGGK